MDSGFVLRTPRNDGEGLSKTRGNSATKKPDGQITRKSVHPLAQKYSAHPVGQISDINLRVSPNDGRIMIVTNVRWDAVDAKRVQDERA
jgi:hypothetical protein